MTKINRNDPCWCGSGKKYKKCHLAEDEQKGTAGTAPQADTASTAAAPAPVFKMPKRRPKSNIAIKTPKQIAGIARASRLTSEILTALEGIIAPGITTEEINSFVHDYTVRNGATPAPLNYKGFPKSVCTSLNNVICHGIPADEECVEGDILNVDVTCILDGYFGDSNRMYHIGDVHAEDIRLIEETKTCLDLGIEAAQPGHRFGDIGYAIQRHAEACGFSVVREYTGHGIGLQFHEDPQVLHYGRPGSGEQILPGMVFTIEPMINAGSHRVAHLDDGWTALTQDGSMSAQWEHTIVITESGPEILTAPFALTEGEGTWRT